MPNLDRLTRSRLPLTNSRAESPIRIMRTGMPALDSVHSTSHFSSPKGTRIQVIHTSETDEYEKAHAAIADVLKSAAPITTEAIRSAGKSHKAVSDTFAGSARKAAKLSIATGAVEPLGDVNAIVASLVPDDQMINHNPPITTDPSSGRVDEEQRRVGLKGFLYACSREADNDFHMIVGEDPNSNVEVYMTMELSGLPDDPNSPAFPDLKAARDAFKQYFGNNLPQATYDFYDPPIPLAIEASLFFDMTHATGQAPGPKSLKSRMPTIWECHPVSKITFEP